MSTMALQSIGYLTSSCSKMGSLSRNQSISASCIMSLNPNSSRTGKNELSTEFQRYPIPQSEITYTSNLHFDRLQLSDEVLDLENRLEFGQFMACEAMLDEEYWTASWLRAETHWEECKNDNVRTEDKNIRHTVVKSVVGTLDLIIGQLSHGEDFPRSLNPNSSRTGKNELSTEFQRYPIPQSEITYTSNLHFDRLQLSIEMLDQENRLEFGQFMACEATLDEE
ncbi:hypothetical protein RND71_008214 [Anisodus tanguticus]|uniref:Uncharacterized protein n=1 Tax=Anisodus tanguticus TaxID=243964 RepID=A0AAE1SNB2_9SOLA|nr:hypothetical protein RND71_008214 [Anisodus tanguticus]